MAGIEIIDHSAELLAALAARMPLALEAVGQQAEAHAKNVIREEGRIDTGRLRNSVTHTVVDHEVYIGTNLDYAPYHELGTGIYASQGNGRQTPWTYVDSKGVGHQTRGLKPIHFLKRAASEHTDEYQKIVEKVLKG